MADFGESIHDRERATFDPTSGILSGTDKMNMTALERFASRLEGILNSLQDTDIKIKNTDVLYETAKKIEHIENLNAIAYVLGYFIVSGKKSINIDNMNIVFENLDKFTNDGIKKEDVIRYCRYWINLS